MSLLKKWGRSGGHPVSAESAKSAQSSRETNSADTADIAYGRRGLGREGEVPGRAEAEHPKDRYARLCTAYCRGCFDCPDYNPAALYFCRKYRTPEGEWKQ